MSRDNCLKQLVVPISEVAPSVTKRTTPSLSKYTEAIRPDDNTIHATFEPRENVKVDIRTRRRYGEGVPDNTPEFTPQDFDIKQESDLVAETINEVDDALEEPNMRRAIKSAFHVEWASGQRPTGKASVTVILTDESKDVGMGSAGEGSAKVFWSPYSNRDLYEKGKSKYGMLGVDPIATLAHEYHHALGGAGELDIFSDAVGAKIHLRHNLELIDPKYVKDWIWSNTNAIARSPKSHHGIEAREALGFAREGNPALFDKLLSETGYSPEALQKVKDQIAITTRKWKTLEKQKPETEIISTPIIKRVAPEIKPPTKATQYSINKVEQASKIIEDLASKEIIRESATRRRQLVSAYESIELHARKLGIIIPKLGTYYHPEQYLENARQMLEGVQKSYEPSPH